MSKIIGVNFRNIGKIYYFDPMDLELKAGDHVIVETSRGIEYGKVVFGPTEIEETRIHQPLRQVCRIATNEDDLHAQENHDKEREAYKICSAKIREHQLEMKLIDVEYSYDNSKILFYFTADGRIDFRQLVKDLAAVFKTRIELRQIGVRDETKILGGIGICGRPLCCHTWLTDFVPVSIRMAKEQNLSLNQTKISGVCGRLMCCLKNEQETYEELNSRLPSMGDTVTLPEGTSGVVCGVNVLRELVKVSVEENDEKEIHEYPVDELSFHSRKKKGKGNQRETSGGNNHPAQAKKEPQKGEETRKEHSQKDNARREDVHGRQEKESSKRSESNQGTESSAKNERRRRDGRKNRKHTEHQTDGVKITSEEHKKREDRAGEGAEAVKTE